MGIVDGMKKAIIAVQITLHQMIFAHGRKGEMMDDLISRQAAIDALDCINGTEEVLRSLPSAQPEIIHCKDCRWWDKYSDYDNGYCMAAKHGYFSKHWEINIIRTYRGNFYCADAEPKGEQA